MESAQLVVVDRFQENVEAVNKLLKDSGITIHIIGADSTHSLERVLQEHKPFLIIVCGDADGLPEAAAIAQLAARHSVPLALRIDPQDSRAVRQALAVTACTIINATEHEQLLHVVREHLARREAAASTAGVHDQLAELQSLHGLLLHSAGDAIAYLHEGLHIRANEAYLNRLGVADADALAGLSILELMQAERHDLRQLFRDMARGLFPDGPVSVRVCPPGEEAFTGAVTFAPARLEQENCVQMILRSSDRVSPVQVEPNASTDTDPLTGLPNRDEFIPQLASYLKDLEQRAVASALFYLQPDGFAEYQKTLGHLGADSFLADFAGLLKSCLGETDLACRFSDYQFAALVRRDRLPDIEAFGQRLKEAAAGHQLEIGHHVLETSCSVGMVMLGPAVTCADQVLVQARDACGKAAESGNCIVRHKANLSMVAAEGADHRWAERLRFALDHGNFYSLQQSVINLDGVPDGLQDMRSYLRDELGDVPPEDYLAAADACHLGSEVDRALIPGLLRSFASNPDSHRFILRISRGSLLDNGFSAWLGQQLRENAIPAGNLVLELPADDVAANLSCASRLAEELREVGCGLALSDFDDDIRHLRLLGSLEVEIVRLRQELVDQLAEKPDSRDTVRQLVTTIVRAGAEALAGGAHDAPHLAALWQAGIKRVVGDFLEESSEVAAS